PGEPASGADTPYRGYRSPAGPLGDLEAIMMKMMKSLICYTVLFFASFSTVARAAEEMPVWIQERISHAEETPGRIVRYEHDNKYYFIFEPPLETKDYFYGLYDANGKYICAPWGGLFGVGDQKCPEM